MVSLELLLLDSDDVFEGDRRTGNLDVFVIVMGRDLRRQRFLSWHRAEAPPGRFGRRCRVPAIS